MEGGFGFAQAAYSIAIPLVSYGGAVGAEIANLPSPIFVRSVRWPRERWVQKADAGL